MNKRRRDDQRRDEKQRDRQVYYLSTLKVIAETLNKSVSLPETFASTLPLVVELLGLHTAWVFLYNEQGHFEVVMHHHLPPALAYPGPAWEGECTCQRLARTGELHTAAQVVECSRLHSAPGDRQGLAYHASVPLLKGDQMLGIMNVATPQWELFTPQDLQILSAVGYQIAAAIERTQLAAQAMRTALVEERNRLAREVHDTLAQELAGIALQLEAADALLDTAPERARVRLRQALYQTRESLAEARRSVLDLRAGPLERQTLSTALEALGRRFAEETGIAVTTDISLGELRLPAQAEEALYRIAQEALTNIRRHAHARTARIRLTLEGRQVQLSVTDDGQGIAQGAVEAAARHLDGHGFGLIGMRERAHMLHGTMEIQSCSGAGTRIEVCIPLISP